jgi:DNA mismatch repair ATPase MutS
MPKEGFSLFSLFDFTVLQKGKAYLKYLFQSPLKNASMIKKRQSSILLLAKLDRSHSASPCFYSDL